ncbi:TonB-dependent receptor, partial [bacterium]|nr:TonB-dependent receptor [bacterium]
MMKRLELLRVILILMLGLSFSWSVAQAQEESTPVTPTTTDVTPESPAASQDEPQKPATEETEAVSPAESAIEQSEQSEAAPEAASSEAGMELLLFGEEIMVMTATKRLQKLSEVPGSVTIITEQEIREKGALTLKELLLHFPGTEFAHEGIFETMRFRGMQNSYNNKSLILINGRKVNTVDWGNFHNHFGYNLDNIKQIEIVKGPGSSLYGANAFAGVVNIITKDGKDIRGVNTKLSLGSKPGDAELSQYYLVTCGKMAGDIDYTVSAGYWRQFSYDPISREEPNELFEGNKADLSLKYKDDLVVRAGYHKMEIPYMGSVYSPTPKTQNHEESFYLDTKYNLDLGELSNLSIRLQDTYINNNGWQVTYGIDRIKIDTISDLPPGAILIIDETGNVFPVTDAVGGYYMGLNDFMGLLDGTSLVEAATVRGPLNELLAEVQYDLAWPQNNYFIVGLSFTHDWSAGEYFAFDEVSDQNYALYLQDEYHALDNLILLAGVRYDYNTDYGSNLSPRGSIIYSPLSGLRLKALYGSAFRAPVFMERYTLTNYGFFVATGNADLKPEKIEQSEVSIEYEFGKWLQAKGAYFYWETKDEIQFTYESAPLYVYSPDMSLISPLMPALPGMFYTAQLNGVPAMVSWSNANSRIAHGFELESTVRPLPYTQFKVSYTRFNLYSRMWPQHPSWAEGDADMFNSMLGFHYENLFFVNLYAHFGRMPNQIGEETGHALDLEDVAPKIKAKWLSQYD